MPRKTTKRTVKKRAKKRIKKVRGYALRALDFNASVVWNSKTHRWNKVRSVGDVRRNG